MNNGSNKNVHSFVPEVLANQVNLPCQVLQSKANIHNLNQPVVSAPSVSFSLYGTAERLVKQSAGKNLNHAGQIF